MQVTTKKRGPDLFSRPMFHWTQTNQTNKPTPKERVKYSHCRQTYCKYTCSSYQTHSPVKYPIYPHQTTQPYTFFSNFITCQYLSPILCHWFDLSDSFIYSSGTEYFKSEKRLFIALVFSLEIHVLVQCKPS